MTRSVFGGSYPPGCSGTPYDQDDGVSDLQEAVLELLEAAAVPTEVNDKIVALIQGAERARAMAKVEAERRQKVAELKASKALSRLLINRGNTDGK
jgi:hypothetical protein